MGSVPVGPGSAALTLAFFRRIHPDKGTDLAIERARRAGRPLVLAEIVQDHAYFDKRGTPVIATRLGSVRSTIPGRRFGVVAWGSSPGTCGLPTTRALSGVSRTSVRRTMRGATRATSGASRASQVRTRSTAHLGAVEALAQITAP